jgi:hypothetical protein
LLKPRVGVQSGLEQEKAVTSGSDPKRSSASLDMRSKTADGPEFVGKYLPEAPRQSEVGRTYFRRPRSPFEATVGVCISVQTRFN